MLATRQLGKLAALGLLGIALERPSFGQGTSAEAKADLPYFEYVEDNFDDDVRSVTREVLLSQPNGLTLGNETFIFTRNMRQAEELIGATVRPVDSLFRAQIDLPDDQGLIIGSVDAYGPAARIGLKANDILLTLNDIPIAKFEDITKTLKTLPDKAIPLVLLRKGKKQTISVKPVTMVTFGPVENTVTSYVIGVAVNPVDTILREHLNAESKAVKEGLTVTQVIEGKPADKAGIKRGDILLTVNDTPLKTVQDLTAKVQQSEGDPIKIELQRGSKGIVAEFRPEISKVTTDPEPKIAIKYQTKPQSQVGFLPRDLHTNFKITPGQLARIPGELASEKTTATPTAVENVRFEVLEAQIKALQKATEELQAAIKENGKK